jgi:uncharacterized protein
MRQPLILLSCLALLATAACGDDAASAPAPTPGIEDQLAGPGEGIPLDSLYGARAAENVRLTQVEIEALILPRGWDGMRVAVISDFHLGRWEDNESVAAAAVQRALAARPDLVVLLGNYVVNGQEMEGLTRALAGLRGRPVMAVLGARDVRSDSVQARVTRALTDLGIRVLVNQAAPFERGGDTAWIAGLDPDLSSRGIGDQEYILAVTGGPITPLLLTHNPLFAARAPEGRRPAILAGNTFCGRLEMPGTPRLAWYRQTALPGAVVPDTERLFRIRGNTMFLTCGVGYSFLPVRLAAAPEVALVTLRAVGLPDEPPVDPGAAALDTILQRYEVTETPETTPQPAEPEP